MSTMALEGGFLEMTEEDKLIDKFIDEEGNISEDELSKLSGESPKTIEIEKEVESDEQSGEGESPEDSSESNELEPEVVEQPEVSEEKQSKRAKAESNQAKAIRIEREKRKELERALKLQAERSAKIEDVLSKVLEPKEEVKEAVPDPDEDPVGYQNYKIDRLEKLQQQHQEQLRQQYEYQQQLQQQQQFISAYAQKAKEFSQEEPDFMDAYRHLVSERIEEHLMAGYDQATANELMKQEEAAIVAKAFEDGENPAERIYNLAKRRGYSQSAKSQSGQAPKSSKLDMVKQGLKVNKSLGSNQGSAAKQVESFDENDIDNMSDAEIEKLWKLAKTGKLNFN